MERLDREWYLMDQGLDADNNAFANISEEYTQKKEQQLQQNSKKRMSAQQREISKVFRRFLATRICDFCDMNWRFLEHK